MNTNWYVYILRCSDDSFYTGITNNLKRRLHEHNHNNSTGSKYVRTRRPVSIAYYEIAQSKSDALKREITVKKLSREAKKQLASGRIAQW